MPSLPSDRSGKATLRAQVLSQRDQLSDEARAHASIEIFARVAPALATAKPGSVVAVYAAKGSEVEALRIDARARQLGLRVVYPRVVRTQRWLDFHFAEPAELQPGSFGLREPVPTSPRAELAEIGYFFVPGIAFDPLGGRIGWGRGYYDNTFARAPQAMRFGLAFECQVVERVPLAEHDILLHGLFTEAEIRRFGV